MALSSSGQSTAAPSDVDEPGPAPTVPRIRRHRPPKVSPEELRAALLSAISEGDVNAAEVRATLVFFACFSPTCTLGRSLCYFA